MSAHPDAAPEPYLAGTAPGRPAFQVKRGGIGGRHPLVGTVRSALPRIEASIASSQPAFSMALRLVDP